MRRVIKNIINNMLSPAGVELRRKSANKDLSEVKSLSGNTQSIFDRQAYLEEIEFQYILWLDRLYEKISRVPGHIVELGVAHGRNSIIFSRLMQLNGETSTRKYFGFDTFDGYTERTLETNPHLSADVWKDCQEEKILERLSRAGVKGQVTLFAGDLLETLPQFIESRPNFRCALLYVDCNAYEPALGGMEILKDYMAPGGIIAIDEKQQGGETRAMIEFCKNHGLRFERDSGPFAVPAYTKLERRDLS